MDPGLGPNVRHPACDGPLDPYPAQSRAQVADSERLRIAPGRGCTQILAFGALSEAPTHPLTVAQIGGDCARELESKADHAP